MKKTIFLIISLIVVLGAKSQILTDQNWQDITVAYSEDDWKTTEKLALEYIEKIGKTECDDRARVLYFHLFAVTGQVIADERTYDDLEEIANNLIGETFITPLREVTSQEQAANKLYLHDRMPMRGISVTTGAYNEFIHSFENFLFTYNITLKQYEGKLVACGGKLTKVKVNRDRSLTYILKLEFEQAFVK